jgi:acyl-CoA synthetase (AMP-forming)/AMP-acid ligase II
MGNLAELGRRWAHVRPEQVAVRCLDRDLTYGELDRSSDDLARGLAGIGVEQGDRVGVLLLNGVELPELVVATLKLGAIAVPLNVMLTASELAPIVTDAGCSVVVTEEALLPNLQQASEQLPDLQVFTLTGVAGTKPLDDLRVTGPSGPAGAPRPIADVDESAPAFICYTSGTTGIQKGAVLTHGSIRPAAVAKILAEGLTYHERMLVPVALVYTGAIISCFMQITYYLGATLVLERNADPDHLLEVIEHERITVMTGVPVVYERMAASPTFADRDISSLRSVTAGGAPVSLDLLQAFQAKGVPMLQCYGMTECSGLASILDFGDAVDHIGFAGLPVLGTTITIRDAAGREVPRGEVGEVCIRGPHVMSGYWNRPDLSAETVVDGWLHSGDLGFHDEDGFLKLVDRKKDMLISGGHNVYPAEIERALGALTTVDELAVIGVADERWGEVPLLVVSSGRDPELVAEEVRSVCRTELARYKWPKYVVALTGPIPRTFSGKVSKPTLREQFAQVPPSAIALSG